MPLSSSPTISLQNLSLLMLVVLRNCSSLARVVTVPIQNGASTSTSIERTAANNGDEYKTHASAWTLGLKRMVEGSIPSLA